jgi:hypothetical protein
MNLAQREGRAGGPRHLRHGLLETRRELVVDRPWQSDQIFFVTGGLTSRQTDVFGYVVVPVKAG